MKTRFALLALILFSTLSFAQKNSAPKELLGMWEASLNNSTEEVPFGLEIKQEIPEGTLIAAVLNGPERMRFSSTKFENGTLTLRFEQYDGTLTAKLEGGKLLGEYFRPYAKGVVHYPFQARPFKPKPVSDGVGITDTFFYHRLDLQGEFIYKVTDKSG